MPHPVHSPAVLLPLAAAALLLVHCGEAPPPMVPPPPTAEPAATEPPPAAEPAPAATHEKEAHAGPPHWTYSGAEGAAHWGDLGPDYAACKTGTNQSPIDLVTAAAQLDKALLPLEMSYPALPLHLFNNGHTVQVSNTVEALMKAGGDTWKLVQFHLHSPSEHRVDGKALDLEIHLVHKNDKGALSVVGLLFKKGKENKALAPVLDHAPAEVSKEPRPVDGVKVDLKALVPAKARYYAYDGSLTTPPCSEGVRWYVLAPIGELSDAQLQKFRGAVHGDTSRPVLPLGARKVSRSN